MSSFFGSAAAGSLNDADVQTIIQAKTDAQAAASAAATDSALAASSASSSASSSSAAASSATASATSSDTAAANVTLAREWATQIGSTVDDTYYGAQKYAIDAATSGQNASDSEGNALTSAGNAATSATLASQWAAAPVGQVVDAVGSPGLESARSYATRAQTAAASAVAMPVRDILDADLSAGVYTLQRADLGYLLRTKTTVSTQITLPAGLWTGPGPTSDPSIAVTRVLKRAAGSVTFAGASAVIAPTRLVDQAFLYSVSTALATVTGSHSIVVPAGTGRTITLWTYSLHSADQTTGSLTMAATNLSAGPTAAITEWGTGNVTLGQPVGKVWTGTIADGGAVTVVISPTMPFCYSYVLWAMVSGNVSAAAVGGSQFQGAGAGSNPRFSQAITPTEAQDMLLAGFCMTNVDVSPVTLGGGIAPTVAQTGTTAATPAAKNLTYLFGYEVVPNTTVETYTFSTTTNSHRGNRAGMILKPGTSSSVTLNGSPGTMSTVGQMADILAEDDGTTYNVRVI